MAIFRTLMKKEKLVFKMKTLLTIIALTISTLAMAGFEGVIITEVFNNGSRISAQWFIKNERVKLHLQYKTASEEVSVDFLLTKGSNLMTIVTESESYKGYSTVEKSAISSVFNFEGLLFQGNGTRFEDGTKYQAANNDYQCAIWLSNLDVDLVAFAPFFKADPAFKLIENKKLKGFPKKSLLTNYNGELIYSSTVVNIEEKILSESDFQIPQGFEKRELVEMEYQKE